MPAMGNITVNNFAASPVTYTVLKVGAGLGVWADTLQGTPGGFRLISEEIVVPTDLTKGVYRVRVKAARPVVNGTTGLVDYTSRLNAEFIIPVQATLSERQELYAMGKNFFAHANAQAAVKDLDGVY